MVSLPSERFTRFGNPAWPGLRTANFAAFGSWPEALLKDTESLRNSDALMRVAVPRRRGPAGLRDLFATWGCCCFFTLCAVLSERARWGWYHYPRCVPHVSETLRGQGVERQTLPILSLGRVCARRTQKAFGTACASLSRGVAAPLGCVIFFAFVEIAACTPCTHGLSACTRREVVSLPLVHFACSRNAGRPLVKKANLPFSEVGWA